MNNNQDLKKTTSTDTLQLIIVGDSIVGKTSILVQYTENKFNNNIISTVGIDYYLKTETFDDTSIQVKIWDTAGQERYRSQTNSFFRNAEGVILVYDVTNQETFHNLRNWINNINSNSKDNLKKIIIGNKIDLNREVKKEEAEKFASENKIPYFETSAKENKNINDSIRSLIKSIIETPEYKKKKENQNKKLQDNKNGNGNNGGGQPKDKKECCK